MANEATETNSRTETPVEKKTTPPKKGTAPRSKKKTSASAKKKQKKAILIAVAAVVAAAALIGSGFWISNAVNRTEEPKEPEIITAATLEKVIDVSELSTLEAVYNGIVEVKNNKDKKKTDFYVSYEARVKAGIDFEQIAIEVDNETKTITVTLPEIQINSINVDIASLDYIFIDSKAETSTVSERAYKQCIADVEAEANAENTIYKLARENAKSIIEALIKPFVNQVDKDYLLIIT